MTPDLFDGPWPALRAELHARVDRSAQAHIDALRAQAAEAAHHLNRSIGQRLRRLRESTQPKGAA